MATALPLAVVLTAVDRLSGPLGKAGGKITAFGRKAMGAGSALSLGLTLPIALLGISTVKTAVQFETSMLTVKAMTQSTGEEFAALNASARLLGKETQFSASEAALGMKFLAQAGFDVQEILVSIPRILDLAAASELEMGRAAEIASILLRSQRMEVGQLGELNNILVGTQLSATTSLEELFEAMKLGGPIAAGFGFDVRETSAILGLFAKAGAQASLGGTSFRASLAAILKPSAEARKIFVKLKLRKDHFFDAEGGVLSLRNAVLQLTKAGASAEDTFLIFGRRAGGAMVGLMNEGVEGIDRFMARVEAMGEITEEVAETKMSGLQGKLLRMVSAFKELQIVMGESGLLDAVTKLVLRFTEWFKSMAEAEPATIRLTLGILGVVGALGPLLFLLGTAVLGMGAVVKGVGFMVPVLKTMAVALWTKIIPAVWGFTTALLANPVFLVVTGIVALIAAGIALAKNWDKVSAFFVGIWEWMKGRVGGVLIWMLDKIEAFMSVLPDWMIDLLSGSGTPLGGLLDSRTTIRASLDENLRASRANFDTAFGGRTEAAAMDGLAKVIVDFNNLPAGASVEADPAGTVDLEINTGFAMAGGL